MGLAVEVGHLAFLVKEDEEGAQMLRKTLESVNAVLAKNKLPPHKEPEELPSLENRAPILSYPYSFLHYLRRVAAHAAEHPGWVAKPFPEDSDPATDEVVEEQTSLLESHLLCHSDCEGFYLPMDFKQVIFDDESQIPGEMLGSSFMLMKELVAITSALGIQLVSGQLGDAEVAKIRIAVEMESPLWIEKAVWISLFEAARLSIQHKTAIYFT